MLRFVALVLLLALAGCARPLPSPPNPAPSTEVRLLPDASGVTARLGIDEAVPEGLLLIELKNLPSEAVAHWMVGIIDGQNHNHTLGHLGDRSNQYYTVPADAAPGQAYLWISAWEDYPSNGSIRLPFTLLPAYGTYQTDALGISFQVPTGWRLHETADGIRLVQTLEFAPTLEEEIHIARCPDAKCVPEEGRTSDPMQVWLGDRRASRYDLQRTSADGSRSWTEVHLLVRGIDLSEAFPSQDTNGRSRTLETIGQSLRFLDEPPPLDPATLCGPVLAGVHTPIGAGWVKSAEEPCWSRWTKDLWEFTVSWGQPSGPSMVYPILEGIPLENGRYQGHLGMAMMEKTGAPFWGPTPWALEVTGERGRITLTCGMAQGADLEQGRARQAEVDATCPRLLRQVKVGDLGR